MRRAAPLVVGTAAHIERTRPYLSASLKVSATSEGHIVWLTMTDCVARTELFLDDGRINCRRAAELLGELSVDVTAGTVLEEWWGAQGLLGRVKADEPLRGKPIASLSRADFAALLGRNVVLPVCFLIPSLGGFMRNLYGSAVAFNTTRPPTGPA